MKKYIVTGVLIGMALFLYNCSGPKKATASAPPAVTYESHVKSVVESNCVPCHFPAKGGNKKAYDNVSNLKTDIDEIIRRIELNPGDRGFMPFKRPKLADSAISVFKQWKASGLVEN